MERKREWLRTHRKRGFDSSLYVLFHQNLKHFAFLYIQRKLREVSTKYQLFQKPANFEQRMLDCKRVLDSVKAELYVLDMKDIEPDVIQSHFDKCMVITTLWLDFLVFCLACISHHLLLSIFKGVCFCVLAEIITALPWKSISTELVESLD